MSAVTQKNYDDARKLRHEMREANGGRCFAPSGSVCDDTHCECEQIAFDKTMQTLFIHATPKADACAHDFQGWRQFEDGNGGEQVCTKCGIGAMAHTLSLGDL